MCESCVYVCVYVFLYFYICICVYVCVVVQCARKKRLCVGKWRSNDSLKCSCDVTFQQHAAPPANDDEEEGDQDANEDDADADGGE